MMMRAATITKTINCTSSTIKRSKSESKTVLNANINHRHEKKKSLLRLRNKGNTQNVSCSAMDNGSSNSFQKRERASAAQVSNERRMTPLLRTNKRNNKNSNTVRANAASATMEKFQSFSALFSNLFPLWTVLSAVLAIMRPEFFTFMTTPMITFCLALLMFSMGITLTIEDFTRVFKKPDVIGLGFIMCYVIMPLLAFGIGNLLGLQGPLLAGLILVGSINGGQASNLCAYIARGDVALSVLMTTATTIGCIFMTPLICKLALGAIVDVNAIGMALSTIKVVLVPVVLGVTLNKVTPKTCRTVEPFCPIVGVTMTIILVGGSVAQCADGILNAGMKLQLAAFLLHLIGGVVGYWGMKVFKYSETICRTCAIETAMKSSAFGFLLASLHFPDFLVRVPSAVSVVWMAIMGSMMAVVWRFIPVKDGE